MSSIPGELKEGERNDLSSEGEDTLSILKRGLGGGRESEYEGGLERVWMVREK